MDKETKIAIVMITIIVILLLTGVFTQPHFEKKAFNKLSKTKATYWDAFWSQLRIEANRANN